MVRGSQKARYTRTRLLRVIGEVIEQAREAKGLSQRELSDQVDRSHGFIWHVEKGTSKLQLWELWQVAYALDITVAELVSRVDERL